MYPDGACSSEWLYAWPHGKKQVWLERTRDRFAFGKKLHGENETIRKLTRPNSLFLSAAAQNNHAALGPVYEHFTAPNIVQRVTTSPRYHTPFIHSELSRLMLAPPSTPEWQELNQIVTLMQSADVGIQGIGSGPDRASPEDTSTRTVRLFHRLASTELRPLPLETESDGTLTLLHLGLRLFKVLAVGGVFLVDELEGSLHPALAREIVALFQPVRRHPLPGGACLERLDARSSLMGKRRREVDLRRRPPSRTAKTRILLVCEGVLHIKAIGLGADPLKLVQGRASGPHIGATM